MEDWRKDARREPILVDLEALVSETHLLRKIERVMDYEWLYERLAPYYCHDNGRPGADPVVMYCDPPTGRISCCRSRSQNGHGLPSSVPRYPMREPPIDWEPVRSCSRIPMYRSGAIPVRC